MTCCKYIRLSYLVGLGWIVQTVRVTSSCDNPKPHPLQADACFGTKHVLLACCTAALAAWYCTDTHTHEQPVLGDTAGFQQHCGQCKRQWRPCNDATNRSFYSASHSLTCSSTHQFTHPPADPLRHPPTPYLACMCYKRRLQHAA